jgi:hypothetical protein
MLLHLSHFAGAMLDTASLRERLSAQERTYASGFLVSHALVTLPA